MTLRWALSGVFRIVWSVVTTGMRRSRIIARMWLPAGPPKRPNSCCRLTISTPFRFRKSAARR